jgi:hypothetical protein
MIHNQNSFNRRVCKMDRKAIAERLRALASGDKRSKAARLRDVIDDVEAALAAGVSRASVVEELTKHGLEMTLATFGATLERIRRQKRGRPSITAGLPVDPVDAEPGAENTGGGSHNPADLDKIIGSKPDLAALAKLAKLRPARIL